MLRIPAVDSSLTPAVLLGGRESALAAARGLRRTGVHVTVLGEVPDDAPWRHSDACVAGRVAGVADWMGWLMTAPAPAVLLPCGDPGAELIARYRAELVARGHRPVEANDGASLSVLDKARAYEIARAAGIGTPHAVRVRTVADIDDCAITFPCATKPVHSHPFLRHYGGEAKGTMLSDRAHARRVLAPILEAGFEMVLMEMIRDAAHECLSWCAYLDEHSRPLACLTKAKVRQFPIDFGTGTYHVIRWEPDIEAAGLRFAQAAGLRGPVHIEFKRDVRDGEPKLIECNPRFPAPTALLAAAGVDLPLLAYNRLTGRVLPPRESPREGLAMWMDFRDLRALRAYRRAGEMTVEGWARSLLRPQVPALFALDDPRPSLCAWCRRVCILARDRLGVPRRTAKAAAAGPYAGVPVQAPASSMGRMRAPRLGQRRRDAARAAHERAQTAALAAHGRPEHD